MTARLRLVLALLWLLVLLLAGWWIGARVQLKGDLRKFMPARDEIGVESGFQAARAADATAAAAAFILPLECVQ